MLNLLGNERNIEAEREAAREAKRERREFQRRIVYLCSGFLAGAIVTIIALSPIIGK